MLFIKALFLFIPIVIVLSIVVYIHLLILLNIFNYIRLKWYMNDVSFLFDFKYKEKSAVKLFFAFFLLIHFLLFIDYYRSYVNSETKYHDAKVYYAVGLVPHTYSVILGRFLTPLNPIVYGIVKPTNFMKEYLFEKGIKYIPNTDAERELWEYEWFYYPYAVHFWDMYDSYHKKRLIVTSKISRKSYDYYSKRIKRLYKIIKALNEKKIHDLNREADALKKIPLMAYYYRDKGSHIYSADNFIPKKQLHEGWKVYERKQSKIKNWLLNIPKKVQNHTQYQKWKNEHLKAFYKVEAIRQFVVLEVMQDDLLKEIKENKFHCKNKSTKSYINLRNSFIMGGDNSVLDKLANSGAEKEANIIEGDFKNWDKAYFFQLMLRKYCFVEILGDARSKSDFRNKSIMGTGKIGRFREIIKKLNKGKVNE